LQGYFRFISYEVQEDLFEMGDILGALILLMFSAFAHSAVYPLAFRGGASLMFDFALF
jgi:hypothetical protein